MVFKDFEELERSFYPSEKKTVVVAAAHAKGEKTWQNIF